MPIVSQGPVAPLRWDSGRVSRVLSKQAVRRVAPVAFVAMVVLGGCTTVVDGDPSAATRSTAPTLNRTMDLRERSVTAADFPDGYAATEVTGGQLGAILGDTAGVPAGGTVDPATCAPQQLPSDSDDAVAFVATGPGVNAGVLTALTVLVDTPLSQLKSQIEQCPTYTTDVMGAPAIVTTTLLPPSPASADESLAFRRVTSSGGTSQTMTALVGQNDDIRVYVSTVASGQRPPDGAALDQLYTTALTRSAG